MRDTISLSEFQSLNLILSTYEQGQFNEALEQYQKIKEFWPNATMLISIEGTSESLTFDSANIYLDLEKNIHIGYDSYRKKYSIGLYGLHKLPYFESADTEKAGRGLEEPNHIGVLSAKKLQQWYDYCAAKWANLLQISADKVAKVKAFREELKTLGEVKIWGTDANKGTEKGEIMRGHIRFRYEIHNSGYITQNIEVNFKPDSLSYIEFFNKLSDNGLK